MGWEREFNKLIDLNEADFEAIVNDSFSAISKVHQQSLENLAIVVEDEPSLAQRRNLRLHCNQTLFGLFEGVPRTHKSSMSPYDLPDKITIFRLPLLRASRDKNSLRENVANTLWHEIGHYFGLDHKRIHKLENKTGNS